MDMEDKRYNDADFGEKETNETEIKNEDGINAQNVNNAEQGEEALRQELSDKEKTNEVEGEDNALKAESAPLEEKGTDGADSTADAPENEIKTEPVSECVWGDSTYHIKPENMKEYVGRRTDDTHQYKYGYYYANVSDDLQDENNGEEKAKKKKSKKALVIALVAVFVAIALTLGGAVGGYLAADFDSDDTTDAQSTQEDNGGPVEMNKNNNPVEVRIKESESGAPELTRSAVVGLVADAVVEITTSRVQTNSFFGGSYVTGGAGSGVVIAQNDTYAYIVTNYHVIEGANKVDVTLTDKTVVEAEYLDGDASRDIAMIRIKTDKKFPKIVCGSSDNLTVGLDVIAIGNPLGQLGGTVTEGIVSALDRAITIDGHSMHLIQTSAAVNPGNSGGGLFNMAGELIGIVNAKQSAEGIEGLGFAIPIDSVYDMLVDIIENGYIHGRATIGIEVEYVSDVWTAYSKYNLPTTGVFVSSSTNEALKTRDLLRSINGHLITDNSSYAAAISELKIGETVKVEVYRNQKLTEVEVKVEEYVPTGIFD